MNYIHIISRDNNKWAVCKRSAKRALKLFKYRELAFEYACNIRNKSPGFYDAIVVHNKDGGIEFMDEKVKS